MGWAPITATAVLACAPSAPPYREPAAMQVMPDWRRVTAFLDAEVAGGAAPGAVLGVSVGGTRFIHATGQLGRDDAAPVTPATVYDLASLTKVVGLTTAVMLAVDEGKLELDAPVRRYLPEFHGKAKDLVTPRMLLAHAGGMPAWRPLFREARSRPEAFELAYQTPLESHPGDSTVYSDLGMIVLTAVVEAVFQERLDSLLHRRVFQPLGMKSVGFLPPAEFVPCIAPTELDPWRGRLLRGEVHDENAARMEGVSGHAGLFGSAPDLLTFAEWLLQEQAGGSTGRRHGGGGFESRAGPLRVRPSTVQEFTRRQQIVPESSRALGWDTPSPGGSAGSLLSARSFGHTGFTGTSLWIDPERRLAIVLLSNRVNPSRENPRWTTVRARLADLVMITLLEDAR